jgi:predicted nucleic acid-binding Zn ribbon protein
MNDERLKDCPECGEAELHRLVSAAGFRLKGAGWYETDFKKGSKKNLHDSGGSTATSSKKSTSDSGKSAAKKTESTSKTTKSIAD